MFWSFGTQQLGRNWKIDMQDIPIKKQQGIKCLVLAGWRYFSLFYLILKEGFNLYGVHFSRMAFVVKENVVPGSVNIGNLSAVGIMLQANCITNESGRGVLGFWVDWSLIKVCLKKDGVYYFTVWLQ
jgi:hypothetical protein